MNPQQTTEAGAGFKHGRALLFLSLGVAIICLERLCRYGYFPIDKDAFHYYLCWKIFSASAIEDVGRLFWTPFVDCGRPVLADPVTQTCYPGQVLFFLFSSTLAWKIFVSTHFAIQFYSLRKFCLEFTDAKIAATIAALTCLLSGPVLSHHWSPIWYCGLAWFPLALVYSSRLINRSSNPWKNTRMLALCYVLLILGGSLELLLAVFYFIVFAILFRLSTEISKESKKLKLLQTQLKQCLWPMVAGLIAFALSSVQLLPMLELISLSDRASGLKPEELETWTFFPARFVETVAPAFFGSNHGDYWIVSFFTGDFRSFGPFLTSVYLGYGLIFLACLGFFAQGWKRRLFFSVILLFLGAMALGPGYGVFDLAHSMLPGIRAFRYTEKIFTLIPIFLAPLIAIGLKELTQDSKLLYSANLKRILSVFHCLSIFGVVSLFLVQGFLVDSYVSQYQSIGMSETKANEIVQQMQYSLLRGYLPLFVLTCVTQISALANWPQFKKIRALLILLVVFIDLGYSSSYAVSHAPIVALFEPPPFWGFNPKALRKRRRIVSERPFFKIRVVPQHGQIFGFDSLDAYGSARLKNRQRFDDSFDLTTEVLRQQQACADFALAPKGERKNLIEFKARKPLPRISWLEAVAKMDPNDEKALAQFLKREPNGALLDAQVKAKHFSKSSRNTIETLSETATMIDLEVTCEEARWLIIRDTFYPGWTATIDNKPALIVPANHCFRAVFVPQGEHSVHFHFQPGFLKMSVALTVIGFVGLLILGRRAN